MYRYKETEKKTENRVLYQVITCNALLKEPAASKKVFGEDETFLLKKYV